MPGNDEKIILTNQPVEEAKSPLIVSSSDCAEAALANSINDAALAAALAPAFRGAHADTWETKLSNAGTGCVRADGGVAGDFWLRDAHVRANNLALARDHLRYGAYLRHGPLLHFSDSPLRCGAGVLAGQHTDALLAELGYDAAAIAQLRSDKVVWSESLDPLPAADSRRS